MKKNVKRENEERTGKEQKTNLMPSFNKRL